MNRHWRIFFLLRQGELHPEMRDAWQQLAAEWMVTAHLEAR